MGEGREALRGVAPEDMYKYVPFVGEDAVEVFRCFQNRTRVVPFAAVNDGYCDCRDGSDEPGTEACAGQKHTLFYCPNVDSLPSYTYASHVNDGICDCCDGSDEWRRWATCLNSCAEEGLALQRSFDEKLSDLRNGLGKRRTLVEQGHAHKTNAYQQLEQLRAALPTLEAAERAAAPSLLATAPTGTWCFIVIAGVCGLAFAALFLVIYRRRRSEKKIKLLPTEEILKRIELLFSVSLNLERVDPGERLGLTIEPHGVEMGLAITGLDSSGAIGRWNDAQPLQTCCVRIGDRIIAVTYKNEWMEDIFATTMSDMQKAFKFMASRQFSNFALTVSAPRPETEVRVLSGIVAGAKLNLQSDLQLCEIDGGKAGWQVVKLSPKLIEWNSKMRQAGSCITQCIDVGDRLVPLDDAQLGKELLVAKIRFPSQVHIERFEVQLERRETTDKIGIRIQPSPSSPRHLAVVEVFPDPTSLIGSYCDQLGVPKVLAGDHLVSVNGTTAVPDMLSELRAGRVLLGFERYKDIGGTCNKTEMAHTGQDFEPAQIDPSAPQQGMADQSIPKPHRRVSQKTRVIAMSFVIVFLAWLTFHARTTPSAVTPEVVSISESSDASESPVVSEYAKWMDGADKALGESETSPSASLPENPSDQDSTPLAPPTVSENMPSEGSHSAANMTGTESQAMTARLGQQFGRFIQLVKSKLKLKPYSETLHQEAKTKLSESRQKISDLQKKLEDLSSNSEDLLAYSSLEDTCLEKTISGYRYKLCFFGTAEQDSMTIGRWKRWESPHVALFDDGNMCPGGPARSLRVQMSCGMDPELLDLSEPSRCSYVAEMKHPGACSEARLELVLKASRSPRRPDSEEV